MPSSTPRDLGGLDVGERLLLGVLLAHGEGEDEVEGGGVVVVRLRGRTGFVAVAGVVAVMVGDVAVEVVDAVVDAAGPALRGSSGVVGGGVVQNVPKTRFTIRIRRRRRGEEEDGREEKSSPNDGVTTRGLSVDSARV